MGMESYGGESRPDVLNSLWPEGRDSLKYGDNHLRLVKTVVKNFYSDFNSFKTKIEGYFDSSGNAKKALDSDKLGEQDPSYYLDGANATGTLSGTKVQSSTTARRGTVQLYNGVDSSSTALAATANAAKQAYDRATQALNKANSAASFGSVQLGPEYRSKAYWEDRESDYGPQLDPGLVSYLVVAKDRSDTFLCGFYRRRNNGRVGIRARYRRL